MSDFLKDAQSFVSNLDAETARLKASTAEKREQLDREMARFEARPQQVGMQNDISDPKDMGIIFAWKDHKGNMVYTRKGVDGSGGPVTSDEVQVLAERIEPQRTAFGALKPEEQQQLRAEFDQTKGKAESTRPYGEHLRSESLGVRFAQIKAKGPTTEPAPLKPLSPLPPLPPLK